MNQLCLFATNADGLWECSGCGYVYRFKLTKPPYRHCDSPPDLTPLLSRLAEETNHPEILDQTAVYARAVIHWAAEEFPVRDTESRQIALDACGVCVDHAHGMCRHQSSCEKKHHSIVVERACEVLTWMATEGCRRREW